MIGNRTTPAARFARVAWLFCALVLAAQIATANESTCFGSVSNGRLDGGVKLPTDGRNFQPYGILGATLGRTYVHSKVRDAVVAAYAALENAAPGTTFVYGETGWAGGGSIRPHRTHQNGLSVDFMVPVTAAGGRPATLPRNLVNRFGYDIEFDAQARYESLSIDFEAIGEHLYQLDHAAKQAGIGIAQVIFDKQFLPRLFATRRGTWLKQRLRFMRGEPWIRHDEHYHVDFAVACRPMVD